MYVQYLQGSEAWTVFGSEDSRASAEPVQRREARETSLKRVHPRGRSDRRGLRRPPKRLGP